MGEKQMDAFFQKMMEDKHLKDQVATIKDDMEAVYAKVAKIARDAGFDVTAEDVRASRLTIGRSGKLDDKEIDKLAGGCSSVCGEICGTNLGIWAGRQ